MKNFSWPFFTVGCILLAVTIILGFWAFSLEKLASHQIVIFRCFFALCSGFACGAFAGSFSVKARNAISGLLVTATGGFGMFFLTYTFPLGGEIGPTPPDPNDRVDRLRGEIMSLRGDWETLRQNKQLINEPARDRVYSKAPLLAEQMLDLDFGIKLGHKIDREQYGAYALFMAADTANLKGHHEQRDRWIDEGLEHLNKAEGFLQDSLAEAKKSEDEYFIRLRQAIHDFHDQERIKFLRIMFYALDAQTRNKHTTDQVITEFDALVKKEPEALKRLEIDTTTTPYLNEVLSSVKPTL